MKTANLVNLLLAVTVVGASARPGSSTELIHLVAERPSATQIAHVSPATDWGSMKTIQKGGQQADSFPLAESPQPATFSPLSDGVTAIRIGNIMGYVDASGRLMGLATP